MNEVTITPADFKSRPGFYVDEALRGVRVILERRGVPMVELVEVREAQRLRALEPAAERRAGR